MNELWHPSLSNETHKWTNYILQAYLILLGVWEFCNLTNTIRIFPDHSLHFLKHMLAGLLPTLQHFWNVQLYIMGTDATVSFRDSVAIMHRGSTHHSSQPLFNNKILHLVILHCIKYRRRKWHYMTLLVLIFDALLRTWRPHFISHYASDSHIQKPALTHIETTQEHLQTSQVSFPESQSLHFLPTSAYSVFAYTLLPTLLLPSEGFLETT